MKDILKNFFKQKGGAISYADYIRFVLYHPEYGYYMNRKKKIGKKGDFITTSQVSSFFGEMFYRIFKRLVQQNIIQPTFVELGAGEGNFFISFLKAWQKDDKKLPLKVFLVEKSSFHRENIKTKIRESFVYLYDSLENIEMDMNGFIFSNELFDAFPVHVIEKQNGIVYEIFISIDEQTGILFEVKKPLKNKQILSLLGNKWIFIEENQRIEISLDMLEFLTHIDKRMKQSIVTTIDYGYFSDEYKNRNVQKGTLRGYMNHQLIYQVLDYPFEIDITSHVHFGLYQKKCLSLGWKEILSKRQDQFLLDAGILEYLKEHYDPNPFSEEAKHNRAIRSLIIPGSISESFHVIMHSKGLEINEQHLLNMKTGNS